MTTPQRQKQRERVRRAFVFAAKEQFQELKQRHESSSALLAPISPTPSRLISRVLPALELSSESLLLDLGCGDGRWLIQACEQTNCRCVGCDVDEGRLALARAQIADKELNARIRVLQQDALDFLRTSPLVVQSNVIIVYLFREAMQKISDILQQRLVRRSRSQETGNKPDNVQVVSVGFSLPGFHSCLVGSDHHDGMNVYTYDIS